MAMRGPLAQGPSDRLDQSSSTGGVKASRPASGDGLSPSPGPSNGGSPAWGACESPCLRPSALAAWERARSRSPCPPAESSSAACRLAAAALAISSLAAPSLATPPLATPSPWRSPPEVSHPRTPHPALGLLQWITVLTEGGRAVDGPVSPGLDPSPASRGPRSWRPPQQPPMQAAGVLRPRARAAATGARRCAARPASHAGALRGRSPRRRAGRARGDGASPCSACGRR